MPRKPIEEVKGQVEKLGLVLLSTDYFGTKKPIEVKCPTHGPFTTTLQNLSRNKSACLACAKNFFQSKEKPVKASVAKPEALPPPPLDLNHETVLSEIGAFLGTHVPVKEIKDGFLIPDKKLIVKCYSTHNSTEQYKHKNDHFKTMQVANKAGYRLVTVFQDEWLMRQEQVKGFLLSILGISAFKVFARKCIVKKIDGKTASTFTEEHHIQGKATVKYAFGIFYNEELLGVMTFDKHHRGAADSSDIVLNRLCFKYGVSVVGGASRLLKHAIDSFLGYYTRIVSWSDNRWSEGNVYEKLNFIREEDLPPDYSYVKEGQLKRTSKQSMQKKYLVKMGGVGDTEKEMSLSLGYYRIWDCGKIRWTLDI